MRLIDIINGPWAILPDYHREIQDVYKSHRTDKDGLKKATADLQIMRKDPLSSAVVSAAADGRNVDNRGTYTVIDGVAIIPIHDVIAKRMSFFMEICGGCSSQVLMRDFAAAQNDVSVKGIILYADTPGGTVDGTMEAAGVIASARGNKPVKAFSDGMICSAGVWLVAGADEIYISSDTNPIGSIGVVSAHIDVSKREEMFGRVITELTAGEYKRIASNYAPLTSEGRAYIQNHLDHIYTAFLNHVAPLRSLSIEDHLTWADGRVFLGSESIDARLVDGVSTLDDLINSIAAGKVSPTRQQKQKAGATGKTLTQEDGIMDVKTLKEQHPDVAEAIAAEARQGMVAETAVSAERGRIITLAGAVLGEEPGKKFGAIIESGMSVETIQTLGIDIGVSTGSTVDKESRAEILDAIKKNGGQPLGKTTDSSKSDVTGDFGAKVEAHARENNCSRSDAIRACRKADAKGYAAWISGSNSGAAADEDEGSE